MIIGLHAIIYTTDADGVRAFLKDVLGLPSVDAGRGWLIFKAPPAELAAHPSEDESHHELYLMCDDLPATMADLTAKGVAFEGPVIEARFGSMTSIKLPGGGTLGLYQPKHPMAISLPSS